ncbi:MAG: DNA-directed RNA polymerase [Candidatus Micrarchaeota archaeon]
MYQMITVYDRVRLPAQYFSMKVSEGLMSILRENYERRIDRNLGIVLLVSNVQAQGDGMVIPSDGAAYYDVKFDALTYLPAVNEVVEAEVSELVEFGAFVGIGSVEGLIHLSQIANDFLNYNKKTPAFVGKESKKTLKKGDRVLAKVSTISLKSSLSETKIGLTMRPEGLGKLEWIDERAKKTAAPPAGEPKEAKPEKAKKKSKEKE